MHAQPAVQREPPRAEETLDITFETDALTTLAQLFGRHGDAYRAFSPALERNLWVLSHPDHVRHVLVDHHANFTKGVGIERVAILLGNGLMTSEGDQWRMQRKMILADVERRRRDGIRRDDILSLLIDARDRGSGEPMPDRQLLDEIMTIIIAGHETTASSLNWFWYLLTQAPEVAARIHAEVDAASAEPPAYDQLEHFPYVRRALDETLRLYPPGWLLTRRSIGAMSIGEYLLPPRTDVLISPYLIQRHPAYWPDPNAFDPDRFLPERGAARNRFVYLPFGLGPRACIGEHLALIEMHAHAIMLARRFALTLAPGQTVEIEPQVNLRTRQPVHMHVRKRR